MILKLFRRWFIGGLLLLFAGYLHADLPDTVAQALKQAGIPETHVGILIQDADPLHSNPVPMLAHGEHRPFNPASVMKLMTTLAALDHLGPAYTFKTRVLTEGAISDGILHGTLMLQGGGDPALTLERFWLLLREVRARGIREIRGDVILDTGYYQLEAMDTAAFDQAPLRPYNAPPSALLVNFNLLKLRIRIEDETTRITTWLEPAPASAQLALSNQLTLSDAACHGWREEIKPRINQGSLILSGSYPRVCGEQSLPLNLLPPEATAALIFSALWQELGGVHTGRVRPGSVAPTARLLFEFESPPLAQLVRDINKYSNNVMAKMLFLNLGAIRFAVPATWDKGARALNAWVDERGFTMPELVLENGSGLSRIERISAASLARLLTYAAKSPVYYEFAASLPALGQEGTLKGRLTDSAAAGRAWLKTGSLNEAKNWAGYVLGPDERRYILVMLVNHAHAADVGKAQAALLEWIMLKKNLSPPETVFPP